MKKTLLLALALIAVGCAEPIPRNLDELVLTVVDDVYVWLDRETMSPYSGPVFRFFPGDTTQVEFIGRLKDGKRGGAWETYTRQGLLITSGTYRDGESCGEWFVGANALSGSGGTVTYPPC